MIRGELARSGPDCTLRRSLLVCAVAAPGSLGLLAAAGAWVAGLALAAGILIGSANGFLARRALASGLDFRASSLGRLALLSAAGVGFGLLLGEAMVPLVVLGIAAAQVTLAVVAALDAIAQARP